MSYRRPCEEHIRQKMIDETRTVWKMVWVKVTKASRWTPARTDVVLIGLSWYL